MHAILSCYAYLRLLEQPANPSPPKACRCPMLEHRKSNRRRVKQYAKLIFHDGRPAQTCIILDVSETGAGLLVENVNSLPETFLLFRKSDSSLHEAVVARRTLKIVGVRLLPPPDLASVTAKVRDELKDLSPIFAR